MRKKLLHLTFAVLALLAGSSAIGQSTAFTYQGQLSDGTEPANGAYDFQFTVRDAATSGNAVGVSPLAATLSVSNGLFTVTLDPGLGVFTGAARWLEIAVRTNGTSPFTTLSPCQLITATPYATFAASASASGLSGTIAAANIANGSITSAKLMAGTITSNQLAASAVTADKLSADVGVWSVNSGNVFRSNGNVGIGVTNPTALLHVNGAIKINGASTLEFGAGVAGKEANAGKIGYQSFGPGALDIVGAGTNGPSRQIRFWAEGGAQFMGAISAPSANIPTLVGNVTVSGNLGSSGPISAPSATIPTLTGNVTVNGTLASGGAFSAPSATIPTLGGNVTVNGNLGSSGSISAPSAAIPTLDGNVTVNGTLTSGGTFSAPSATIPALSGDVAVNGALTSSGVKVNGANSLELGAGVAGKEPSAGKIGYEAFGPGALDIVGAGTTPANRQIRFWAEGGSQFGGPISASSATIPTLNGNVTVSGEITANVVTVTGGSDVAEPYHVAGAADVKPVAGMVVAINPDEIGQMRIASRAYDKTVAGILSGANGIAPGITLRQAGTIADGTMPVASIGRVWCYCDADANGPIEAGDMLTTSNTPGHAMKVADCEQANGSIIGKAMSPLKSGRGLVLVFVSLK